MLKPALLLFCFFSLLGMCEAQRAASAAGTSVTEAQLIARPEVGPDGFRVVEFRDLKIADGQQSREGKFFKKYSFDLKAGESFHIVGYATQFNVCLSPTIGSARVQPVRDTTYISGESYAYYDGKVSTDETVQFTISNENQLKGDETYYLQVVIATDSVRIPPSQNFCDMLALIARNGRYDFFMLKSEYLGRVENPAGYIDHYKCVLGTDEISYFLKQSPEYYTVVFASEDLNACKAQLDNTYALVKNCIESWQFTPKLSEKSDESLPKDFGPVQYSIEFQDMDSYSYTIMLSLGAYPKGKGYIMTCQIYLK